MPCCIAILDYAQCRHSTLYKLGCTADCDELCPAAQQEMLLRTRFRWRCEECHALRCGADADARTDRWNNAARRIMDEAANTSNTSDTTKTANTANSANTTKTDIDRGRDGCADADADADADATTQSREMRVLALRDREEFEEELQEARRVAQVEEIQYAEEWTSQYGRALFALCHGPRGRRRWQRQRQWWRRRREEERRSEDDDDVVGDAIDQHTEAAKQHMDRLRTLQQCDLVVVRDALRPEKEPGAGDGKEQHDQAGLVTLPHGHGGEE